MADLQWNVGHLQGRILGLNFDLCSLKALLAVCWLQADRMRKEDEPDEEHVTLCGLFRVGETIVEEFQQSIKELEEIAHDGERRDRATKEPRKED
jgi:hypothetical protein